MSYRRKPPASDVRIPTRTTTARIEPAATVIACQFKLLQSWSSFAEQAPSRVCQMGAGGPSTVTAFFGQSNTTDLSFSDNTTIGSWTFNAGASDYTFTNAQILDFTSAGIVINGDSATITNNFGATLQFSQDSTAGGATITSNFGATLQFIQNSTADNAAITHGTANMQFANNSTGGSATITNNGRIRFQLNSTGGDAQLINNAGGLVDFSGSTGPAGDGEISAGSIAGAGDSYLGSNTLTVGSNDLDTTVSGVISDCGADGNG